MYLENNFQIKILIIVNFGKPDILKIILVSLEIKGLKIIGKIDTISTNSIKIEAPSNVPPKDAFIMFSKNKIANNASLNGYFAEVKLNNNSTEKAELFSLGSEIMISSK